MLAQTLGRYRLIEKIGQGGMGVVYRAHDERLDRFVAIKVLPPGALSDDRARSRFRREAITLAKLNHPVIAAVHDFDSQADTDFLVIEFVPGENLSDTLTLGPLSQDKIVDLGSQLCDGLGSAHLHGVIHRDLKPANLRITPEGKLKILDFGLARLTEAPVGVDVTQSAVSSHVGFAGTLPYVSPEQLSGHPPDVQSDIYAVGVVLYEMATGRRPFPQSRPAELINAIVHEKALAPSSLNPQISPKLDAVILKTIDKDPQGRYRTAAELGTDLERLESPVAMPAARTPRSISRFRPVFVTILIGAMICLSIFGYKRLHKQTELNATINPSTPDSSVPAFPHARNIAILPINVSDHAPFQYLANGLRESLQSKLIRLSELTLAPISSVNRAIGSAPVVPSQLARDVGSNLVLSGSMKGTEHEISVSLNLDDVVRAKSVWRSDFVGSKNAFFLLENEIAVAVVGALNLKPTSSDLATLKSHPSVETSTYELYLRGQAAMRLEDSAGAFQFFQQALEREPNFAPAIAGAAAACQAISKDKRGSVWATRAIRFARMAENLHDDNPEVGFAVSDVYRRNGMNTESIKTLERVIQMAPNSIEAYRLIGNVYLDESEKQKAVEAYKKGVDLNPYDPAPHIDLGRAYFSMGLHDKSVEQLRMVTELAPENPTGWSDLGTAYAEIEKYPESIAAFQKSISLAPTWLAYSGLGYEHVAEHQYPEAIQALEKSVELEPKQELAMGNLADAYRYNGQKDKANATYKKAIALANKAVLVNPRATSALSDIGVYYAEMGEPDIGMKFIKRARAIDNKDPNLVVQQAVVEVIAKRPSDAVQTLREALTDGASVRDLASSEDFKKLQNSPEFEKLWNEYQSTTK